MTLDSLTLGREARVTCGDGGKHRSLYLARTGPCAAGAVAELASDSLRLLAKLQRIVIPNPMKKTKIMTLTFDTSQMRFDDRIWEDFQKQHAIVSVESYFFDAGATPCLTLVATYVDRQDTQPVGSKKSSSQPEAWRRLLDDSNIGLFELLRGWRSRCAREEGVPPYVLLTNIQLAEITRRRPASLRYMDDFVLFGQDSKQLSFWQKQIDSYLRETLFLQLKAKALRLAPVATGLGFLGFNIFPNLIRINRSGLIRARQKIRRAEDHATVQSVLAHLSTADSVRLRQKEWTWI